MFKGKSLITKIALIALISSSLQTHQTQTFFSFNIFTNAYNFVKKELYNPIKNKYNSVKTKYENTKKIAKITTYSLGGFIAYKAIIKPISRFDTKIKTLILASIFFGTFYIYNKFVVQRNIKKIINKAKNEINQHVDQSMDKLKDDFSPRLDAINTGVSDVSNKVNRINETTADTNKNTHEIKQLIQGEKLRENK